MTNYVISSGQTSLGMILNSGDFLGVNSGGAASSLEIGSAALAVISGGGSAIGVTVDNGGALMLLPGANVTGLDNIGGELISTGLALLSNLVLQSTSSGTISGLQLSSGSSDYLLSGATVIGAVIDGGGVTSGATQRMWGGTASGTVLRNGGYENVNSGSLSVSAVVSSGGVQNTRTGGVASGTYVSSGGHAGALFGGIDFDATVDGAGVPNNTFLYVFNGGSSIDTQLVSGGLESVYSGGFASGTTVGAQSVQEVWSNGVAVSTTVLSGGYQSVNFQGVASDTQLLASGSLQYVFSGGSAISSVLDSGGEASVYSGGLAFATTVGNLGSQFLFSNGMAISTTVLSGGRQYVNQQGVASHTNLLASGGWQYVYSGGSAISSVLDFGGSEVVSSGGSAYATSVNELSLQQVAVGGFASATSVGNLGVQAVVSSGLAVSTFVGGGGSQFVAFGGVASGADIVGNGASPNTFAAEQYVYSGGSAVDTVVDSGGTQDVYSGGVVSDTIVLGGGTLVIGNQGAATGIMVRNGGTVDLAVFTSTADASASFNFATDLLTVSGGGSSTTLGLSGNYVGDSFALSAGQYGGTAVTVVAGSASLVGSGVDLLGMDELDSFYVTSNGQLGVEYTPTGAASPINLPLSLNGLAYIPTNGSVVLGAGLDILGQGGHDIFLAAPSGHVEIVEINPAGSVLGTELLSGVSLSASGSIIGTGTNLWGAGGTDIFYRNSINAVTAYEFNTSGTVVASHALTAQGNPFSLDAASTIVGNGLNIWGTGNRDIFVRTATGALTAWEFNPAGVAQVAHALDTGINPFIIDNATTVTGSGFNFWGSGNADMFVRGANGNISAWEFNYVGLATVGQNLMASAGVSFTLDGASTIVGTGLDFLGTTYEDIFVRSGSGQLSVDEFNPNALETASAALTSGGSAFTIDSASAVIGTGINVLGTGNHDLFVANAAGDVSVDEFNSSGALTASATLTQGGSALVLPLASTVIGSGFNFLGDGDADIFVRSPNNSITAMELTAAGSIVASVELMVGSSPFQLDGSSTIIGTGSDFFGSGNNDIFVRTSTDQIDVWEYTKAGVAVQGQQLTVAGQPFLLDGGSTIIGTGMDYLGTGGSDIFVQNASGAMSAWEFNSAGVATVGQTLTVWPSGPFTLAAGSVIVGSGHALRGAGPEVFSVAPNGQLSIEMFSPGGYNGDAYALETTGATPFTLPAADMVLVAGDSADGNNEYFVVTNPAGQSTAYSFNGFNATPVSGGVTFQEGPVFGNTAGNSNITTVILGASGAETLTANTAQTMLIGNGGNDIYDIGGSAGVTTILNGDLASGASSTMAFLSPSIGASNLWFDRVNDLGALSATGPDLRIDVLGTSESVTVNNWFSGGPFQALAEIEVSGSAHYLDTGLTALMSAMSAYEANNPSFNPATAGGTITNAAVLSAVNAAWHS